MAHVCSAMQKQIDPVVSTMAKLLGSKGGSRNSDAQKKARKSNVNAMLKARGIRPKAKAA